jgi:hypothetical protein
VEWDAGMGADAASTGSGCGNLVCDPGEDCSTCPAECECVCTVAPEPLTDPVEVDGSLSLNAVAAGCLGVNIAGTLTASNEQCQGGAACDQCAGVAVGGSVTATVFCQHFGVGLGGSGNAKMCHAQECPDGSEQFVCATSEAGCNERSSGFQTSVTQGVVWDLCAQAPALCRVGVLPASGSVSLDVTGTYAQRDGVPTGTCNCCENGASSTEITAGPQLRAQLSAPFEVRLWKQSLTLRANASACATGTLGAGTTCAGDVVPAGSLQVYAAICIDTDAGISGGELSLSGDLLNVCAGMGWFRLCWSMPRCPLQIGDSSACPM